MKQNPIWAFVFVLVSFCFISLPQASAAGSLQSYAVDKYYLGAGGTPPTLSQFGSNPRAYLRSEVAYNSLKNHFSKQLGRSLSESEFSSLMQSNQVRLVSCTGRIKTSGISQKGSVGWSNRACYTGEQLIQLNVNGQWRTVASQGCFNLVQLNEPSAPPFQVTTSRALSSAQVFIQQTAGVHVHTSQCCHGCGVDIYLPGSRVILLQNR
jgi:hypothetical protein